MKLKFLAMMALLVGTTACNTSDKNDDATPIGHNDLTLEGDRMTPEALWAMGRIGSVVPDIEVGNTAYTVSYYSVVKTARPLGCDWLRRKTARSKPTTNLWAATLLGGAMRN